jgi:hypothetical protein
MLQFIDNAIRHKDEFIFKYNSETLQQLKEFTPLRDNESGKQVKRFRTDAGGE